MKFSLIIPVYNVKEYLETCVQSVLNQRETDLEILLVDDGSTDGVCPGLCDKLGAEHPDLIRVVHQPNGGLGAARNTGIQTAQGDYLAFLDSDDTLLPGFFEDMRCILDTYHCDIVDFGMRSVSPDGTVLSTLVSSLPKNTVLSLSDCPEILTQLPNVVNRIYKRSLFLDNGILFPSRVWYEDMRTTPKLMALAESLVSIDAPYYDYLAREGSITRNANVERNAEIIDAFEDLRVWFTERGLWTCYTNEFSRLAVDHILLAASVRVIRSDPASPLLESFRQYMDLQLPGFRDNPLLQSLPKQHKLLLKLLESRHYKTIRAMFALKDHIF